jgi:hypothetical protein
MNILDSIMNAGNGAAVRQIGSQVGLDESQTAAALSALVPALSAGLQQNLQSADGLAGLIGALSGGSHQRYVDNPAVLGEAELSPTATVSSVTSLAAKTSAAGLRLRRGHKQALGPTS